MLWVIRMFCGLMLWCIILLVCVVLSVEVIWVMMVIVCGGVSGLKCLSMLLRLVFFIRCIFKNIWLLILL